jgi:octaprenyl-diphosphate synthase
MVTREPSGQANAKPASSPALFGLLEAHLRALDDFLHAQLADFEPEIREFATYCVDTSGKRIRPALVFFSGWKDDGGISEAHVRLAAVIEMVHLATLVHDDIMDRAELRRNRLTAARKFGPDTAVLLGDALFSQALHVAAQFPTTEVCRRVAASTRQVCSGEIMQTLGDQKEVDHLRRYRRVIELKTAELFKVSCYLGAHLAGAPTEFSRVAGQFGRHLGTAYQIYDDLADFFGSETKIGKTLGTDLAGGKATLPLLLLVGRLPPSEANALQREMAAGNAQNLSHRIAQMVELNIAEDVLREIHAEICSGTSLLAAWEEIPATLRLRELAAILEAQAVALRRPV